MPIPNPVYGLMVPFLCVVTLPLAIFAGITTTLAFSVLMFRVMVVYLDIAVSLVPQYLMGRSTTAPNQNQQSHPLPSTSRQQHYFLEGTRSSSSKSLAASDGTAVPGSGHATPPLPLGGYLPSSTSGTSGHRSPTRTASHTYAHAHAHFASAPSSVLGPSAGRRSRRGSLGGASAAGGSSVGTITPVREEETPLSSSSSQDPTIGSGGAAWSAGGAGPSSFAMLKEHQSGSNSAIVRDFEGVGGWRLASDDKGADGGDDEDDDSDWANINSRLELPLERMWNQQHNQGGGYREQQHHHRTPSGHSGSVTPGEGSWLMMKNHRNRGGGGGEQLIVATDFVERESGRDGNGNATWGSGAVQQHPAAGAGLSTSGRTSISPNSSRVRIGQGIVSFTGVERNEGYFPPAASPKSTRKAA